VADVVTFEILLSVPTTVIPTFKLRRGRVTPAQAGALSRLWADLGVAVDGAPLDLPRLFGRDGPVVLEIGFGMGEATVEVARTAPDQDVLAVDVHTPGVGNLLRLVEREQLTNVRVAEGDALTLLADMLAPGSLAAVHVFFPDPWPKTRHAKRRLVTPAFADLVAARLRPGGLLHVATDWAPYAEQVHRVVAEHAAFAVEAAVPWRPRTRFERRGTDAGRASHDIAARRLDTHLRLPTEPAPRPPHEGAA
jgi:tRNA (guanine-N7-)-methyltransferase